MHSKKEMTGEIMPRFFLPPEAFESTRICIDGADARHISRSLRMRVGDELVLCDMSSSEYLCVISSITNESVYADIKEKSISKSEMPCRTVLYQGIAKGDKMDTVIQKAVELGVCEIVPVECERCIAKIPADAEKKKLERWQKIAAEAAGQSQRGIIPRVSPVITYAMAIERMKKSTVAMLCYEDEHTRSVKELLQECKAPEEISFLIGPEGGISPEEARLARENGIPPCSLGRRILRTETASAYVLSAISYAFEL